MTESSEPIGRTELNLRVLKTRVRANNHVQAWLKDNCIAKKQAYNFAVYEFKRAHESGGDEAARKLNWRDLRKRWIVERKENRGWMAERGLYMAGINDGIAVNFSNALRNWKRSGCREKKRPQFHSRKRMLSVTWVYSGSNAPKLDGNLLELPKDKGSLRLAEKLPCSPESVRSITFSFKGGSWCAAILMDAPSDRPRPPAAPEGTPVGVDLGVVRTATLSSGAVYEAPSGLAKALERQKRAQQDLSRMVGRNESKGIKGSKNWWKQVKVLAKRSRRVANIRQDMIEHMTKDIAAKHDFVAVEDLRVKNMTASAKGDEDNPGKNVKQKSGLNRAILDKKFFFFRTRLGDKVHERGGTFVAVDPRNTSLTCVACGRVDKENRTTQSDFTCVSCGHSDNADVNAARNILLKGLESA